MLEKLANVFRVPDLRKRVLFTLGLLAVYRLGGHIPTPGINITRSNELLTTNAGSIFGFFDLFAGERRPRDTVLPRGIMPDCMAYQFRQYLTMLCPGVE